ncbi:MULTISPECIES: ead/Ea22-like family protein [Enterobacter]|uniref:ead/Ea22-like family protein n=1 Tax=Enterobacter TaxID=547 RepID=UPI002075DA14|nr:MULTISPECIES: ead/Ea22-like family protein [Enterobacter]MCM7700300.1 ead/Ea22-like family protein [Enterobacter hormaechei]MCM7705002.1 ead/Ea22-like family protein [Enterobacter hormaechei]MCM7709568.1 ead/Ea22-like family protein [Enterobacter hormaechei]MCM7713854.1 ead/Ea22-like family protein [Enterobacter hormaechei]MCM7762743.1 ead/Ea22-like family protein [Enterobacter hormaechei]
MSNIDKRALRDSAESTIGILENIAGFEPSDIDSDSVELRFETEDGFDTGCDVSIVDQCQKAANVVRALLDELEAKDNRINRLEAIVSVAEQRNELMREWKRALKVPCDLVDDQVPVVIHGMVIRLDRIKETEAKLEAVEKRNERALSLLKDASPENVWDVIGRLKVVIGGDYRSESEIAAAAAKGE